MSRFGGSDTVGSGEPDANGVGPSVWVVSDGRAGIERQALSLASALSSSDRWDDLAHVKSLAHRADPVRVNPRGWQVSLPANLWPTAFSTLPREQRAVFKPPWPDVWIATGRRSIPFSRRMKRLSKGKTLVVQTQDPRTDLAAFDLVIPPEHDELTGPNVFSILGPPTFYGFDAIEDAHLNFGDLAAQAGKKILVSIGGNSNTHKFTPERSIEIEDILKNLAAQGFRLWITVSRRTPEITRARLRTFSGEVGARFWESETVDGPNPYLAFLSMCDAALVTEDSANMLADPAFFGKPTHLLKLEGQSARFDKLHRGFIDRGAAKWFDGTIETWSYAPIREVDRAANKIIDLLLERHPPVS